MDAGLLNEREPLASQPTDTARGHAPLKWITLLLVLILLAQLVQVITAWQRSVAHSRKVEQAQAIVDKQQTIILGLLDSYQKDAYGNTGVDRIDEQQLLATEYTLSALQIMAIQNSQIIGLMVDAP